jgi:dGTPase
MYNHYSVMQIRFKSENIIRSLFTAFMSDIRLLPEQYQQQIDSSSHARVVADYISGMTDRYAFRQYNRLFGVENV